MTPLVLLPGMTCDARLFAPQINAFSGQRPLLLSPIGGHDSMTALAAAVLETAPPLFNLAGLSMGGIVAMEILRRAPERVARLALIDTNPLAEDADRRRLREAQIERVDGGELTTVMRDEMKPHYLVDGPRKRDILELCMAMALDLGADVFVRQSRALLSRPDQTATLRGTRTPTLIMCGAEDALCPPERHRLMQELVPGSSLEIVTGAGHLPTLEQPQATNTALARWMEE